MNNSIHMSIHLGCVTLSNKHDRVNPTWLYSYNPTSVRKWKVNEQCLTNILKRQNVATMENGIHVSFCLRSECLKNCRINDRDKASPDCEEAFIALIIYQHLPACLHTQPLKPLTCMTSTSRLERPRKSCHQSLRFWSCSFSCSNFLGSWEYASTTCTRLSEKSFWKSSRGRSRKTESGRQTIRSENARVMHAVDRNRNQARYIVHAMKAKIDQEKPGMVGICYIIYLAPIPNYLTLTAEKNEREGKRGS